MCMDGHYDCPECDQHFTREQLVKHLRREHNKLDVAELVPGDE